VRHGHEAGEVTLGGRRVSVARPGARTADGEHGIEHRLSRRGKALLDGQ
jgi:hypothetical protein